MLNYSLVVPEIANAILKATGAVAFSIAQNNGKEAKQIIPHVHVHIIPRYADKATMWTKRGIPSDDELKQLQKKLLILSNYDLDYNVIWLQYFLNFPT